MADNHDPDSDRRRDIDRHPPNSSVSAECWLVAIPDGEGETVTFAPPQERVRSGRTTAWLTIDATDVVGLRERR